MEMNGKELSDSNERRMIKAAIDASPFIKYENVPVELQNVPANYMKYTKEEYQEKISKKRNPRIKKRQYRES